MKTFKHIALAFTALLLVTSCAIDEMWEGMDTQDEEKVLTFKPKFEDFETVTKTIGDASNVNELLVQVYEQGKTQLISSEVYEKEDWGSIAIPFYYGKKYEVYFWAYYSDQDPYKIGENGLKSGVSVTYPDGSLSSYDALEYLDAFYAVETIDLSANNDSEVNVSLTRPFAQVNLMAKKDELQNAKASTVVLELSAASAFVPGGNAIGEPVSISFTFTSSDNFQSITESLDGNVYLGTTYIFVSSSPIYGTVTLKDQDDKTLKSASNIEIPLVINSRTNLVFSGIQPAKLPWNDNKFVVPGDDDNDGWIHITCPEELAALLIKPSADNINVHICDDIDMGDVDAEILNQITGKSFLGLKLDGGIYPDNNMEAPPTGNNSIKNISAAAFIGTATNLTVRNLNVDNLQISATTGHVGTLVNTLKGTSSFSNVTVSNSSATTDNGAAGGIVGYIERIAPTTRSEVLEVAFYNCKVNGTAGNPVATGSLAEGKFVGLLNGYDYGETLSFDAECSADENTEVADYESSYTAQNQSCFLTATDSKYDQYLGSESNRRGTVYYGTQRIVPKWDGTTSVKPFFEDSKEMVAQIYSPFDLAYLQGKTLTTLRFKSDVDLAGVCDDCRGGKGNSTIANDNLSTCIHCKPFNGLVALNNLYGENHTLYNMFVQGEHEVGGSDNDGWGFIRHTNSGKFENFTFDGAIIKVIDDFDYRNDDQKGGNGYAGTLTSRVAAKMTINNVHAKNGHVMGISKFGGLIGYVPGGIDAIGCSVENYTIENHKINVVNAYSITKYLGGTGPDDSSLRARCSENFYTEGEAGGFIGFISSNATISQCHTSNITMKCYGQDDRDTKILGEMKMKLFGKVYWADLLKIPYTIAGRHCNPFIGDIRTPSSNVITITDCSTSDNIYVSGYDVDYYGKDGYSTADHGELVGCVYFVGKDITLGDYTMHEGDYKGTVKINGESMPFIGG